MNDAISTDTPEPYVQLPLVQLAKIALIGVLVGLIVWGLTQLLDTYVLQALMCRSDAVSGCNETMRYAEMMASGIGAAFGLFALVRLQVFRPLLVVLATVISFWGMAEMLQSLPLYVAAACSILLHVFAYVCFTWIARVRAFIVVVMSLLLTVIAIRLILSS